LKSLIPGSGSQTSTNINVFSFLRFEIAFIELKVVNKFLE